MNKKKKYIIFVFLILPIILVMSYWNDIRVSLWLHDAALMGGVIHVESKSSYASFDEWINAGKAIPNVEKILKKYIRKQAFREDCFILINALVGIYPAEASFLRDMLKKEKVLAANQEYIVDVLCEMGDKEAIPVIEKIATNIDKWEIQKSHQSARLLVCCIRALSILDNQNSIPLIKEKLLLFEEDGILMQEYREQLLSNKRLIEQALINLEKNLDNRDRN